MKKQMKKLILLCTLITGLSVPAAAYAEPANDAELPSEQVESYANEWVQGKWYNKNGAQTYKGIGSWHKNSRGWWYGDTLNWYPKSQWQKIDGKWYYFNAAGYMTTGWKKLAGVWYYLNPSGAMATGWKKINGSWYFFDEQGRMYSNSYIDQKYFVDEKGRWDGVTIEDTPVVGDIPGADDPAPMPQNGDEKVTITFHQDGWYVARLEVQVWDNAKQDYIWQYSDSCAKGEKTSLTIDTNTYPISRVGYQIWFFGWDNDYLNLPWSRTGNSTDFTLSGYGDYPDFTWK